MSIRYKGLFDQQGFTLLEMILVLMIMGMVASLSVVFIDNEDNQLRYEETIQKLETMHKATVTVKDYKDGFLLSGFVVDNGVLPSDAQDFISIPTDWISSGETYIDTTEPLNPVIKRRIQPYFRLTKKNLSSNVDYPAPDKGYEELPDVPVGIKAKVTAIFNRKGYRAGYISLGIDSAGNYKDGWGDKFFVGDSSVGDSSDPVFPDLKLTDDVSNKPSGFDNSINTNVTKDNWGVSLSDIQIIIENKSGSPITNPIVGIIGFKNIEFLRPSTGDVAEICKECLQTYHFNKTCPLEPSSTDEKEPLTILANTSNTWELSCTETDPVEIPSKFNCIKSTSPIPVLNPIWQTEALEKTENDQTKCIHTDNEDQERAKNVIIPVGEHIVFVGEDIDSDGKLESDDIKAQAILKIIPRFDPSPTVTLVIE